MQAASKILPRKLQGLIQVLPGIKIDLKMSMYVVCMCTHAHTHMLRTFPPHKIQGSFKAVSHFLGLIYMAFLTCVFLESSCNH